MEGRLNRERGRLLDGLKERGTYWTGGHIEERVTGEADLLKKRLIIWRWS